MPARWLDRLLILLFAFASYIAFVYEPMFLYFTQCGWDGLHIGAGGPCEQTGIGRAWLGYLQVEPIYANAPVWIRLVNEFDVFLFGWFYVLSVWVFLSGRQTRTWYKYVGTFVSGMMTYSMVLYLTWETLSVHDSGSNLKAVYMYNGLWLFIFALLMVRLHLYRNASADGKPVIADTARGLRGA